MVQQIISLITPQLGNNSCKTHSFHEKIKGIVCMWKHFPLINEICSRLA